LTGLDAGFAGEKLGAEGFLTQKGKSLVAYDPRSLKGMGVTYATSTMGADHTYCSAILK